MLKMDLEYNHGVLFVRLKGKLIRKKIYKLNNYLIPLILKHKIKYLVCNLNDLEKIDETGINTLLHLKWAIKTNKGLIYLSDVPHNLNEITKRLKIKKLKDESSVLKLIEA